MRFTSTFNDFFLISKINFPVLVHSLVKRKLCVIHIFICFVLTGEACFLLEICDLHSETGNQGLFMHLHLSFDFPQPRIALLVSHLPS